MSGIDPEKVATPDPRDLDFDGLSEFVADHIEATNPKFEDLDRWLYQERVDLERDERAVCLIEAFRRLDGKVPSLTPPKGFSPPPNSVMAMFSSLKSVSKDIFVGAAKQSHSGYLAHLARIQSGSLFDPSEARISRRQARKLYTAFQDAWANSGEDDVNLILQEIESDKDSVLDALKVLYIVNPGSSFITDLLTLTHAFISGLDSSNPRKLDPEWKNFVQRINETYAQGWVAMNEEVHTDYFELGPKQAKRDLQS